jgi:hypothetical protein
MVDAGWAVMQLKLRGVKVRRWHLGTNSELLISPWHRVCAQSLMPLNSMLYITLGAQPCIVMIQSCNSPVGLHAMWCAPMAKITGESVPTDQQAAFLKVLKVALLLRWEK